MIHWPEQLTKKLLNLSTSEWRALRAKVRWAYERSLKQPPNILSSFMRELPEDSYDWITYAREISAQRRVAKVTKIREAARIRDKKARAYHKSYMRGYMVEYRKGLRRRGK